MSRIRICRGVRRTALLALGLLLVALFLMAWTPPAQAATHWFVQQITDNETSDRHVTIEGDYVAWAGTDTAGGGDADIFLRRLPTASTLNISDNHAFDDLRPVIASGYVAWEMNETPDVGDPLTPTIEIMLHNIATGATSQLSDTGAWMHLAENRDGHLLYYGPAPGDGMNVFYVDLISGVTTQVSSSNTQHIGGSSDGQWVVWTGHRSGLAFPYLISYNFVTHQSSPLFPRILPNDGQPHVRDGLLAFVRREGTQWDVYLLNLGTSTLTRITDSAGVDNWIYGFEEDADAGYSLLYGDFDAPYDGATATGNLHLFNTSTFTSAQVTDAAIVQPSDQCLKGDLVVWISRTTPADPNSAEVFVYNLQTEELWQLTDNDYPELSCETDGVHVAWCGQTAPGGPGTEEVFVAGPSALIPPFFRDVLPVHPYYLPIQELRARDLFDGYAAGLDSEFRPGDPLLRAQFAKMLCGAFDLQVSEPMALAPFLDLDEDDPGDLYPHEYVAAAYAAGITNGTSATTFSPWANVSRAQVVTMIVRAAQQLHVGGLQTPPAAYTGSLPAFSDIHRPNMLIAEYNGLLAGLQGFGAAWDPWAAATRAETAQMLWNLLSRME